MQNKIPLLMDVDGCINVLGAGAREILPPSLGGRGLEPHDAVAENGFPYRLHIDPACREWLRDLANEFELVWATTWRNANEVISPLLGLPTDLRQVWFPREWFDVPWDLCRKTPFVRRWAAENGVTELAWFDDEITDSDEFALERDWSRIAPVRGWHQHFTDTPPLQRALCLTLDGGVGLRPEGIDLIRQWGAHADAPHTFKS
jgi:hypothetical protein